MVGHPDGGIQILNDPIGQIRRNPEMYLNGHEVPTGEFLAARTISGLIVLRSLPAKVAVFDEWWVIQSDVDWLAPGTGSYSTDAAFSRMLPFPEAGANSMRFEILLTAFSDALVTVGEDGVRWVKGSFDTCNMPANIDFRSSHRGRLIAFTLKHD